MNDKPKYVAFRDKKLEDAFEKLKEGKKADEVMILSIILEWMTHKEYEKRFKY